MASTPEILRTPAELRAWRRERRGRVGFVPTMGALHAGHARLLEAARPRCDHSVLSIFVNPTQFGPNEDLSRYPRTFERDLFMAGERGVDAVFAPSPEAMYPEGFSTCVEETRLSQPLCGAHRPGHFRGVATVVLKCFNLVQPHSALFGLKDAQQFFVLRKMARDLDLEVEIVGVPTVREPDGLALSSRNAYLAPEDRERAPFLYRELNRVACELAAGASIAATLQSAKAALTAASFEVQYFDCLELPELTRSSADRVDNTRPYVLATAARLGATRLIDNVILGLERLTSAGIQILD